MTHLEANLKDFHLKRDHKKISAYRFRFGHCEDFSDALNQFKKRIDLPDRTPYPEAEWLWEVKANPQNRNALSQIFDNFEESITAAESQMELWG